MLWGGRCCSAAGHPVSRSASGHPPHPLRVASISFPQSPIPALRPASFPPPNGTRLHLTPAPRMRPLASEPSMDEGTGCAGTRVAAVAGWPCEGDRQLPPPQLTFLGLAGTQKLPRLRLRPTTPDTLGRYTLSQPRRWQSLLRAVTASSPWASGMFIPILQATKSRPSALPGDPPWGMFVCLGKNKMLGWNLGDCLCCCCLGSAGTADVLSSSILSLAPGGYDWPLLPAASPPRLPRQGGGD